MDNRRAYGLAKAHGIDTTGMSPREVWEALKEKGVTQENYTSDGAGGTHEATEAEEEKLKERGIDIDRTDNNSAEPSNEELAELLGEEFKGYKGQDAINKLMKEKRGHIKGAFHREDIGDIDLLWGNNNVGLQHIIIRREDEKEGHVEEILSHLAVATEKGNFKKRNERGNFEFVYKENASHYRIIIAPEYHKNKITYVLSAFRRGKNPNKK